MSKFLPFLLCGIVVAASCRCRHAGESILFEPLLRACGDVQGEKCQIHLSDITQFNWERVGFIRMNAPFPDAMKALSIQPFEWHEFEDVIVFAESDRAVYIDRRLYEPEKHSNRSVFLSDDDQLSGNCRIYNRSDDLFLVSILHDDQGGTSITLIHLPSGGENLDPNMPE